MTALGMNALGMAALGVNETGANPQFGQVRMLPATAVHSIATAQGQPRLRITRRGRLVLTSFVAIPVAFAAMFGVLNAGGAIATSQGSSVPLEQFTVEPGQTLWQAASEYAPDSDPRDFIAEVEALNGISGTIEPGQVLDIPAMYSTN